LRPLIHLLLAVRHLERIADLATNIAEDMIYMVKGDSSGIGPKIISPILQRKVEIEHNLTKSNLLTKFSHFPN
jgi:hypothetical protein